MDIKNDIAQSRFVTRVAGGEAKIEYRRGSDGIYDLLHTYVPREAEGQGVAGELVEFAIETAKRENVKLVATCKYVAKWFEKHPDQKGILA